MKIIFREQLHFQLIWTPNRLRNWAIILLYRILLPMVRFTIGKAKTRIRSKKKPKIRQDKKTIFDLDFKIEIIKFDRNQLEERSVVQFNNLASSCKYHKK